MTTKYRRGYKYQLAETQHLVTTIKPTKDIATEFISLTVDGHLTVRRAYCWDGASGPTIDTDNTITPSLAHDVFAQLMRNRLLPQSCRIASNELLEQMLAERGMSWLRRKAWLKTLNWFGAPSTDPKNAKKVYEVE